MSPASQKCVQRLEEHSPGCQGGAPAQDGSVTLRIGFLETTAGECSLWSSLSVEPQPGISGILNFSSFLTPA